jgi:hypothetical protein
VKGTKFVAQQRESSPMMQEKKRREKHKMAHPRSTLRVHFARIIEFCAALLLSSSDFLCVVHTFTEAFVSSVLTE